jgi:hypothetical protein
MLDPLMNTRRMPAGWLAANCPLLINRFNVLRLTPNAWAASSRE